MAEEVVGTIVLTVNGQEFDCASVSPKHNNGRKPVSSMNRQGRVRLTTKTTKSIELSAEVFIPEQGDIDWGAVEDATLTVESLNGTHRVTYTGVYVQDYSNAYSDGSEAKRSLNMFALDKVEEGL